MAEIKAFKGISYNQAKIRIENVITQPYDKITPQLQALYYENSPYNIVRIELNKSSDPYTSAKEHFESWLNEGILVQDDQLCIYPYFQEYGSNKVRKGFIALLKIEDFSSGVVVPHERTFSGPKEDSLQLLRATGANFGLIFMLYSDTELKVQTLIDNEIKNIPPVIAVREAFEKDAYHKLWKVSSPNVIKEIQELMRSKTLLIADGHHRYETALNYSKENPLAKYVMVTFVAMEDTGLLILPTHRAMYGIDKTGFMNNVAKYFDVEPCGDKEELMTKLKGKYHHYGVYDGKFWVLKLKDDSLVEELGEQGRTYEYKALDVTVLHRVILEKVLGIPKEKLLKKECVDYLREIEDGVEGVNRGKYQLFFILNPTRIEEAQKISTQHEVMPQKSTDFYPKLISGLVMYKIE